MEKDICLSNKGAKSTCMSSFIIFFSIEMIMLGYPPFSDKATLDHDIEIYLARDHVSHFWQVQRFAVTEGVFVQ
jgi:hypothetical protein